jgi:integrase
LERWRAPRRAGTRSETYAFGDWVDDVTGLGPEDALSLPRSFFKDNEIATRRSKTGEPVYWPCPAPLLDIIADSPAHDAIKLCANSYGRPWTGSGFRASWRTVRTKLERKGAIGPGLTLYGLRHTVAVILREIGCDERTIADALGQETIEMARHYAKGADLKPKMRGVVKRFDEELDKRKTKIVKPASWKCQTSISFESKKKEIFEWTMA